MLAILTACSSDESDVQETTVTQEQKKVITFEGEAFLEVTGNEKVYYIIEVADLNATIFVYKQDRETLKETVAGLVFEKQPDGDYLAKPVKRNFGSMFTYTLETFDNFETISLRSFQTLGGKTVTTDIPRS